MDAWRLGALLALVVLTAQAGFAGSCNLFYSGLVNNNTTISTDRSEGEWSGTFELNYRPNDDWLLYGKFSRGNKAGGFNTGFLTLFASSAVEFDGEVEFGKQARGFAGGVRIFILLHVTSMSLCNGHRLAKPAVNQYGA